MTYTKVFIYGTLKRGFYNNYLLKRERFVREAKTKPEFRMYSMGTYPAITRNSKGKAVSGEVWEVSPETLHTLDTMETVYGYDRETIQLEDGEEVEAYIYQYFTNSVDEISLGCWA